MNSVSLEDSRPWRVHREHGPSSVEWPGQLPPEDAPPWVCLSRPYTPVVIRSYDFSSRTYDVVSRHGRWILESALVPRTQTWIDELHFGWDIAVGDVSPGLCIVYFGNELWFPQRVLRVDMLSPDWQRVWTLGDASTRDIWTEDENRLRDNGIVGGWSLDDSADPLWEDGPWYPLQSAPLGQNARRFVLHSFNIPGECPECGLFGRPVQYGFPGVPLDPHTVPGGCVTPLLAGMYRCECGFEWTPDEQGRITPAESDERGGEEADLNYDIDEMYPFGEAAADRFMDLQTSLLDAAAEQRGLTYDESGYPLYPFDLLSHYTGYRGDEDF